MSEWGCSSCGFTHNTTSSGSCAACDALKPAATSAMIAAGLAAAALAAGGAIASMLPQPQPPQPSSRAQPHRGDQRGGGASGTWSCPACTLANAASLRTCQACETPRPPAASGSSEGTAIAVDDDFERQQREAISRSLEWCCPRCTVRNSQGAAACATCELPRAGAAGGGSGSGSSGSGGGRPERSVSSVSRAASSQSAERAALQTLGEIRSFCAGTSQPFIDSDFLAGPRSLGDLSVGSQHREPGTRLDAAEIEWVRPQELQPHDLAGAMLAAFGFGGGGGRGGGGGGGRGGGGGWSVFAPGGPRPDDISQGMLGDCWFLCCLAVLAERPRLLERVMLSRELDSSSGGSGSGGSGSGSGGGDGAAAALEPSGAYPVRLCIDGEWRVIIVDDLFPRRRGSSGLAFAKAKRQQLWVPLIEKAYAKAHGSYSAIEAGQVDEGLAAITGAPTEMLYMQPEWKRGGGGGSSKRKRSAEEELAGVQLYRGELWAKILSAAEQGFLLAAGCSKSEPAEQDAARQMGLLPSHAYSCLAVVQVHMRIPAVHSLKFLLIILMRSLAGGSAAADPTAQPVGIARVARRLLGQLGAVDARAARGDSGAAGRAAAAVGAQRQQRGEAGRQRRHFLDELQRLVSVVPLPPVLLLALLPVLPPVLPLVLSLTLLRCSCDFFSDVAVCKVRSEWQEARLPLQLSALSAAGMPAVAIETFDSSGTWANLTLHQPGGRRAEDRLARSVSSTDLAPADIGLLVLEVPPGCEGRPERWRYLGRSKRTLSSNTELETLLKSDSAAAGGRHLVLPIGCMNRLFEDGRARGQPPLRATLAVHSSKPLICSQLSVPLSSVAHALLYAARATGEHNPLRERQPSLFRFGGGGGEEVEIALLHSMQDGGYVLVAENRSADVGFRVTATIGGFNLHSTRGAEVTEDLIPPLHFQILRLETPASTGGHSMQMSMQYGSERSTAAQSRPPIAAGGIHQPLPLPL